MAKYNKIVPLKTESSLFVQPALTWLKEPHIQTTKIHESFPALKWTTHTNFKLPPPIIKALNLGSLSNQLWEVLHWLSFFLLFWWPVLVLWLYERSWNSCDCCFLYNNEKTCNSIFPDLKSNYLREAINWGMAKYLRKFGILLCAPGPSCSKGE